jgi:hypothetical protein
MAYFRGVNCGVHRISRLTEVYYFNGNFTHMLCINTEIVDCFIYILLRAQESIYINLLPIAVSTCVQTLPVAIKHTVYYLCQTYFSLQFIVPVHHLLFLRVYNSDDCELCEPNGWRSGLSQFCRF